MGGMHVSTRRHDGYRFAEMAEIVTKGECDRAPSYVHPGISPRCFCRNSVGLPRTKNCDVFLQVHIVVANVFSIRMLDQQRFGQSGPMDAISRHRAPNRDGRDVEPE